MLPWRVKYGLSRLKGRGTRMNTMIAIRGFVWAGVTAVLLVLAPAGWAQDGAEAKKVETAGVKAAAKKAPKPDSLEQKKKAREERRALRKKLRQEKLAKLDAESDGSRKAMVDEVMRRREKEKGRRSPEPGAKKALTK